MKNLLIIIFSLSIITGLAQSYPKVVHNKQIPPDVRFEINEVINEVSKDSLQEFDQEIIHSNFRYTFNVKPYYLVNNDTIIKCQLTKKEKLYYRPYTALGVTVHCITMVSMIGFSSINLPTDKKLHILAGYYISTGTSLLVYKLTNKKWISVLSGVALSSLAGFSKELIDKHTGGVFNKHDMYYTIAGGASASVIFRLILK